MNRKRDNMESQPSTRILPQFLQHFVVIELAIFGGVALLCIVGGTLTRITYANGLFMAGALVMLIGALVIGGNRSRIHPASRNAENLNLNMALMKERVEHAQTMNESVWSFGPLVTVIGLIPILTSIVLSFIVF